LNFNAYKKDFNEVIERTLSENIWMINVGTKLETSKKAVELAQIYKEGVYAAIGLHPIYAAAEFQKIKTDPDEGEFLIKEQYFDKEAYKKLAESKKVVAIGEIGLDYYYKPKTSTKLKQFKEKQKQIFLQQLELAKELNLPLILHCRMAHDDVIEIIKTQNLRGVIHCFTGTQEQAQKYIDLGFFLGINGIIFKFNINEIIKNTPLDKILVETDCPYLTPLPAVALAKAGPQGYVRNEPIFIKYTIQKIAELKGVSFQEVAEITTQNAKKLFKI
ncbi:MAG: TatD family hydrolase, partial [archaeon]|nr:TatD family hydrolase [archaeon]